MDEKIASFSPLETNQLPRSEFHSIPKQEEPQSPIVKCNFSGYGVPKPATLGLPEDIVSNAESFYEVLSKKTWDECLSEGQKARLLKLLPENVSSSPGTSERFLETFFNPKAKPSPFFNHPLVEFQERLAGGYYDAACANEVHQLKACSRLHYEHYLREHHGRTLKRILVNRRRLLEAAASVPDGESFNYNWKTDYVDNLHRQGVSRSHQDTSSSPAWRRAMKRSRLMIMDCKAHANEPQILSSDDEDLVTPVLTTTKVAPNGHHTAAGHSTGHGRTSSVTEGPRSTSSVRSTLAKPGSIDLDLHEPFGQGDLKDMLKEYRRLRRTHPEHPSLEYDDIELDDVVDRCGSELRFMAHKWGVYTRPLSTSDLGFSSSGTQQSGSTGRKTTGGKQQNKAAVSKDK